MGLDWKALTLAEYLEALEAHNESHAPPGEKPRSEGDPDKLRQVMEARLRS